MFVYQPIFNVLEPKIDKSTEYIIRLYNSKLITLHKHIFLNSRKNFKKKIGIQFNNILLVLEKYS